MIQSFSRWLQRYSHVKWVLADQVMVSGLNFLTGVLLARFLGVEGYGQFVLLYSVLLYGHTLYVALIVSPMMSIAPQVNSDVERTNYLEGMITLQLLFSFLLSLIVFVLGSGVAKWHPSWNLGEKILPLAISILCFQLQDWLRRYYFICRQGKAVFINDVVSYGGQIALLFLFYRFEQLSIANAFWAIAVSSAIAFVLGVLTENISPGWAYTFQAFQQSWQSGRDLLLAGQINWAGSQGILLFGASILGAKAAGGIRAAQNIIGPLNILFQAMENIIPIRAAQHYAQNQLTGLTVYLKKISLLGGLLLAVPCITIALFSKALMELTYGKTYAVFAVLITWQVVYMFMVFFIQQAFYFLRTIGYTKTIVLTTAISSGVGFLFTAILVYNLQELGIMVALVLGQSAGLIFLGGAVKKYLIATVK
jgi:O-antigen/teichoic acid export membrane protein